MILVAAAWAADRDPDVDYQVVGFLDVGAFAVFGPGPAYERDRPGATDGLPEDDDGSTAAWTFWGDPWANAVNSQGESADLGGDRNPLQRVDALHSEGRPIALVNRLQMGLHADPKNRRWGVRVRVNLDPRQGRLGAAGDVISLDAAWLQWHPVKGDVTLYAGRVESGFGGEYPMRRAPARIGVTPSMMARYTVGRQTGLRIRGTAWRWFDYSASLTSGGTVDEALGMLSDEIDRNGAPTLTTRLGAHVGEGVRVTGGLSGELGPRDGQPDLAVLGWMVGADVMVEAGPWVVRADGTIVRLPIAGEGPDGVAAQGAALEGWFHASNHVTPYARVDWRQADLRAGDNRYLSNVLRVTAGVRFDLDYHTAWKLEVLRVEELLGSELRDDVATSSLVVRF